jgi:hypothetical protein
MPNKYIITAIILTTFLSFTFLSYSQEFLAKNNGDWWSLSFQKPQENTLSFAIENFGPSDKFQWSIYSGSDRISEDTVEIPQGEKRIFELGSDFSNISGKQISIKVQRGNSTQTIYKNL